MKIKCFYLFWIKYKIIQSLECFILELDHAPCGYILGTRDSTMFYEKCEREWFFKLRKRYFLPQKKEKSLEADFVRYLHQNQVVAEGLEGYPAHFHIDILPIAQGRGYGRELVKVFLNQLQVQSVQGVHLVVSKQNQKAIGFYKQVGFQKIKQFAGSIVFGQKL